MAASGGVRACSCIIELQMVQLIGHDGRAGRDQGPDRRAVDAVGQEAAGTVPERPLLGCRCSDAIRRTAPSTMSRALAAS